MLSVFYSKLSRRFIMYFLIFLLYSIVMKFPEPLCTIYKLWNSLANPQLIHSSLIKSNTHYTKPDRHSSIPTSPLKPENEIIFFLNTKLFYFSFAKFFCVFFFWIWIEIFLFHYTTRNQQFLTLAFTSPLSNSICFLL